jgi:aerobic-type carbon monoxide dehydrogenase small subunit (CoxS/CutS family)
MIPLTVNGTIYQLDLPPDLPLLWALREHLKLTGTKYGCGIGACGACTVHINGKAVRSCQVTIAQATGKQITTIEGIVENHPVKQAWLAEQVPQCGYCQPGQIMQAAALLQEMPLPSDQEIAQAMSGNLCRCGTYHDIRRAITLAAKGRRRP